MLRKIITKTKLPVPLFVTNASYTTGYIKSVLENKKSENTSEGYEVAPLTQSYFGTGWNLLNEVFLKEEKTCKLLGLHNAPEARKELRDFFWWIFEDGVSLMARDVKKDRLVAINLNKIWIPEDQKCLEDFKSRCKDPLSHKYLQEIMDLDMFKICKTDCVFETIVSVSVKDIRGLGLPMEMYVISLDLAKKLANDDVNKKHGKRNRIPKAVCGMYTHPAAKHAAQKYLNNKVEYNKIIECGGDKNVLDSVIMYSYL